MNYTILFYLIAAHFLFDFPLQGDFTAKAKNHLHPIPGVPWYTAMASHAFLHGAAVGFVTGVPLLGFIEFGLHFCIDILKNECKEKFSNKNLLFNIDQGLHIWCKWFYVLCLALAVHHG